MSDPLDYDPLREEFDQLEREVRQRDCQHAHTVEVREMGQPSRWFCYGCDAMLDRDPSTGEPEAP